MGDSERDANFHALPVLGLALAIVGIVLLTLWPALAGWEHAPRATAALPPAAALPWPQQAAVDREDDDAAEEYLCATQIYRAGRWAAAYGRLAALADRGHPGAARAALFMLRHGEELYGSAWSATGDQVDSWMFTAAQPIPRADFSGGE